MGLKDNSRKVDLQLKSHGVMEMAKQLSREQSIPVERMNLIFNGNAFLQKGKITVRTAATVDGAVDASVQDVKMAHGSVIICILSSGETEDKMTSEEKANDNLGAAEEDTGDHRIVLRTQFNKRPFGFAVWANAQGKNAIVTKVAGQKALELGIQIGYTVSHLNGTKVYGFAHDVVLEKLKTTQTPLTLDFVDLGEEYTCAFKSKPLGFTVIQDREENNAKVSKINTRAAQDLGVKIGSYIVVVNTNKVFGSKHKALVNGINVAKFPIMITFRHPPALLMLAPRSRRARHHKKR